MERSSGYLWGGIGLFAVMLLAGAYLGTRAVADSQPAGPHAASTVAARYARFIAPDSTCPGEDDLAAPAPLQEQTLMCMVNYARGIDGVGPLNVNVALMQSAKLKADDIVRCREFSHDACGVDVRQHFADSGYFRADVETAFGENLAWGGDEAGSPRGAMLGWLDSPEHRANMLKSDWREQGLAFAYVANFRGVANSRIWVSHFGRQG